MAKKASAKALTKLPTKYSSIDKLKADKTTAIRGPDADLLRDLKGKHMIGGHRVSRRTIGKR